MHLMECYREAGTAEQITTKQTIIKSSKPKQKVSNLAPRIKFEDKLKRLQLWEWYWFPSPILWASARL